MIPTLLAVLICASAAATYALGLHDGRREGRRAAQAELRRALGHPTRRPYDQEVES